MSRLLGTPGQIKRTALRANSPTAVNLLIATVLGGGLTQPAEAADWTQTSSGSELRFLAEAQGESFTGKFSAFDTRLRFDPEALDSASFDVRIDLRSVDSANAERDELLVSEDFFAVEQSSEARFQADQVSVSGDGFVAKGRLSLRGVEQSVELKFNFNEADDGKHATLEGSATLDRLSFGVGGGDWADEDIIGREVQVETKVRLERQD